MKYIPSKLLLLPAFLALFGLTLLVSTQTANAQDYPALCGVFTRTLLPGDTGEDVKQLQLVLSQEGIAYLGGTGFYGPVTERAVKTFQTRAGIYAVGKVGPQTFARMRALWCSGTGTVPGGTNPGNGTLDVTLTPTTTGGNSVNLTWASRGAVACRINNESVPLSGTKQYIVTSETSFTVICNDSQNRTAQKNISVRPTQIGTGSLPSINLYLNPTTPTINSYAYLYWTSANASYCSLNGQNISTSGSQQVYISGSATTFSVTCYNSNGQSATQSISSLGGSNTNNTLQLSISTNKTNYTVGESLIATVVIRNNSSYPISYQDPICSLYGPFNLAVNGTEFYSFLETSPRAVCLAYGNTTITLAPYESKTYTYTAIIGNKSFATTSNNLQVTLNSSINNNSTPANTASTYFTINGSGGTTNTPTININPQTQAVTSGANAYVTLTTTNANYCTLSSSNGTVYNQYIANNGTITIFNPTQSATYTVTCTNSYGSNTNTFTVNMGTGGPAPTLIISPTTVNVTSGQYAYLTITTTNVSNYCTYVRSDGGGEGFSVTNGSSFTLGVGTFTSNGTVTINCPGTNGQSISAQAIINVGATGTAPTLSISPTTLNLTSGQNASLTLTTRYVTYCSYNTASGSAQGLSISDATNSVNSTINVGAFTSNGTVTVTCTGNGQTVSAQAIVNISGSTGVPTISLNPTTQSIVYGGTASVVLTTSNATSCTISGGVYSNTATSTSVTLQVSPTTTTTYSVNCSNSYGVSGSYFTVTVTTNNSTNPILSVTPQTQTIDLNQSANLTIATTNIVANSCRISGGGLTNVVFANNSTKAVSPTTTSTYSISCIGTNGQSITGTAVVNVNSTPSLTLTPSVQTVNLGQTANITNAVQNVSSCTISSVNLATQNFALNSSKTVTPNGNTLYTVTCTGVNGQTVTATAIVNVNSTASVSVTPANATVAANTNTNFSVSSTNVTSCSVTGGYYTNQYSPINGILGLMAASTTNYLFSCTGTQGVATTTARITVQ